VVEARVSRPFSFAGLARSAWRDFGRARRPLILFDVLFKLGEAWLLAPAVAVLLSAVLARAGHVALSNRDVFDFLLSPMGLLYGTLFGAVAVALLLVEQAGLMALAASADSPGLPPLTRAVRAALGKALHIFQLGAVQVALLALTLLPFVLLAAVTYGLLLSRHDINFYLAERPPAFWLAAGVGALLALAGLAAGAWLYVRWAFALPILLFEGQSTRAALRASRERARGVGGRVGAVLLGWQLGALLVGLGLRAGFRLVAAAALDRAGERPLALILLLLVCQGGLYAVLSFFTVVGQALLTRRLYLQRSEQLGVLPESASAEEPGPTSPWTNRLAYLFFALGLVAPAAVWADLARDSGPPRRVKATAHRGHSLAAPENTLSAIRKAIDSGADYAEVDVQLTADGVVVLLHDRDFKRVAGVPSRIDELSYDEVRKLDVGSWFGPAFAGERAPTLAEAIDLCRGRIKMNIELKLYGPDLRLAEAVARLVREKGFEDDCLMTSFNKDALAEGKRHDPHLRTGLIVAYALGDVSRLGVEALSVRADWLSDPLLRAAHRRGLEVHVWTVNDARRMGRLMQRGVDNIITDDPDLLIRVRGEWEGRAGAERLLLASRLLLGLDPWDPAEARDPIPPGATPDDTD
jgi:glycerophosphoryl diester phosphodiesterase